MRPRAIRKSGPNTPEGKARVSRNAVKHGLFSSEVVLQHEDLAEFEALRNKVFAELAPKAFMEEMDADEVVVGLWRLRRALRIETANMDKIYAEVLATGENLSPDDRRRRALVAIVSNRYVDNIHGYATKIRGEIQKAEQRLIYQQLSRRAGHPIPIGSLRISLPTGRSRGRPRSGTEK
jgi:hypothetical protein